MKKIILLLLLVLVSVTASARKSYITVTVDDSDGWASKVCLTGDVPVGIAGFVYDSSEPQKMNLSKPLVIMKGENFFD